MLNNDDGRKNGLVMIQNKRYDTKQGWLLTTNNYKPDLTLARLWPYLPHHLCQMG